MKSSNIYSIALVLSLSLLTFNSCKKDKGEVCVDGLEVKFLEQDPQVNCGRLMENSVGDILNPVSGDLSLNVENGETFYIFYDTVEEVNQCPSGTPIHITCSSLERTED